MDGDRSVEEIALAVAHAAHHLKSERSDSAPTFERDGRTEYVEKMLDEEAEAIVAAIELKRELEAGGTKIAAPVPLELEYEAALAYAGRIAARDAVRRALSTGKVAVAGRTESPRSYYERAWDARRRSAEEQRHVEKN